MLFHVLFSFSPMFGIKNVSGSEPAIICCKSPNPVSLKWTIRNQPFINTLPLPGLRNSFFFCLSNRASIVLGHQLWDGPCPKGSGCLADKRQQEKLLPRHCWSSACHTCAEGRASRWLLCGGAVGSILSPIHIIYSFGAPGLVSELLRKFAWARIEKMLICGSVLHRAVISGWLSCHGLSHLWDLAATFNQHIIDTT